MSMGKAHPSHAISQPAHCFAYGSLMFADIMHAVAAMQPVALDASLAGWRRRAIRAVSYPAAFPVPGAPSDELLAGVLWLDLTPAAWLRLDTFEGPEYARVEVEVGSVAGPRKAWIYSFLDLSRVLEHDWDPAAFREAHLAHFFREHGGVLG